MRKFAQLIATTVFGAALVLCLAARAEPAGSCQRSDIHALERRIDALSTEVAASNSASVHVETQLTHLNLTLVNMDRTLSMMWVTGGH